jgi:hypothetical protein
MLSLKLLGFYAAKKDTGMCDDSDGELAGSYEGRRSDVK